MNTELYEKLSLLQWLLHKQHIRGHAEAGPMADTTRGQGRILALLKLRDGISTKDLSYLLGVRVSSLNELISKLEKSGHVTREPSEQDKRVMLVKLTDKGRSMEEPAPVDSGDIFAYLSDGEQRIFGEYLDRVIAALKEKLGDDDEEEYERVKAAHEHFAETMGGHFEQQDYHKMFGSSGRFARGENGHHHGREFKRFDHRGGRRNEHD